MLIYFVLSLLLVTYPFKTQQNNPTYLVENFEIDLSNDWKGRRDGYEEIYQIKTEDTNQYLAAKSYDSDNLIVKKIEVDLVEYPYLNWKWRANVLPQNGDESVKAYCDATASLALVLNTSRFFPKTIKYSWSTTLAKDSLTESPFAFWPAKCDIRIVKSGNSLQGIWQKEKVNVLNDYKQFYGVKGVESKMVYAIVLMTDSDNTQSVSAADYDDIYFSKE